MTSVVTGGFIQHKRTANETYFVRQFVTVEPAAIHPSYTPFQIPSSIALICRAMWVEWNRHIARLPSIYHRPGTPNALYVYTPLLSPSEFTPQIGLIFAIKVAFAGSFDADKILSTLSLVSPILSNKKRPQDGITTVR